MAVLFTQTNHVALYLSKSLENVTDFVLFETQHRLEH